MNPSTADRIVLDDRRKCQKPTENLSTADRIILDDSAPRTSQTFLQVAFHKSDAIIKLVNELVDTGVIKSLN